MRYFLSGEFRTYNSLFIVIGPANWSKFDTVANIPASTKVNPKYFLNEVNSRCGYSGARL